MGPALQGIFVGQGPRALPGVRGKTGRRGEGTPPYGGVAGKCLRGSRADRGVRPYGWFARSLWGGRPRGSPLRTGTRSACVDRGRGRTPPLRRCGRECLRGIPQSASLTAPPPRGRGLRIATTGLRTGLAMTRCKECRGRADVGIGPYGCIARSACGGTHGSRPTSANTLFIHVQDK